MVAGAGMVALHSAADSDTGGKPGETRLSFEADDLAALSARLKAGGTKLVVVHDESYGQVLSCQDPLSDTVWVDGRSTDLYGYRLHQATPDERCKVMPVRFTEPQGSYAGFLEALGLARLGAPDDFYAILSGPGDCGQVGLHRVYSDELPILPGPAAVHLTFETTEPLDDLAARLRSHGFDATVRQEDFGAMLTVTDPDGRECQVHEPPKAGYDV